MSNILDPDQARLFVGPDLGPNCLRISTADDRICHWQAILKRANILSRKDVCLLHLLYVI